MKYYLTGQQAKIIDEHTQNVIGIPGIVLMEKAAEKLATVIDETIKTEAEDPERCLFGFRKDRDKILSIAEGGNNGGDAVAAARILKNAGYDVSVFEINGISRKTESYIKQVEIAGNSGVTFISPDISDEEVFSGFSIIIDGIFGVGLTRDVSGIQSQVIDRINHAREVNSHMYVVGVDIPSGISSDTGCKLGNAVKCDLTVTFQFIKYGSLVGRGREYSGKVVCEDIGLYVPDNISDMQKVLCGLHNVNQFIRYEFTSEEIKSRLPVRSEDSNKGTYGKVLVAAGSKEIYGALYLSAYAAYRTGAGLVKVITDIRNREVLTDKLPEAMMFTYDSEKLEKAEGDIDISDSVNWADVILAGPGLGTGEVSKQILHQIFDNCHEGQKLVLDADALNIVALEGAEKVLLGLSEKLGSGNLLITPHIAEMSRLMGTTIENVKSDPVQSAYDFSEKTGVTVILKDARTYIAVPDITKENNMEESIMEESVGTEETMPVPVYINTYGNSGMSTGGSGDVLAGILSAVLSQAKRGSITSGVAACVSAALHAMAGDRAAEKRGERSLIAGDIIDAIQKIIS